MAMKSTQQNLFSPAKINTLLHILRKRADGYHDLYMHMVPISLGDTIQISYLTLGGIQFQQSGLECGPMAQNLVYQAALAFEKAWGQPLHVEIQLHKQIPVGAGLGGGSSNAATVLKGLNTFFQEPLSQEKLLAMAATLGSDVPFFIASHPAIAQGRGEQLEPLYHYPTFPLIVIKPNFSIPTASAYKLCQPLELPPAILPIADLKGVVSALYNQFEKTLLAQYPALMKLKTQLLDAGALGALVSGSGSAVFGIFEDLSSQSKALEQLSHKDLGQCFPCLAGEKFNSV